MTEIQRTGGDLAIETLEALGARTVFGIPGQHALGLFDALSRGHLDFVSSRVENNAAFAADGFSRATGEVGVLFLSAGPGALTALAGLQEAHATGVPIVVIASQIPRVGLGGARKGLLHQLDDQRDAAAQVSKDTWLVRTPGQIPSAIADAWTLAVSAPAGPVWVEIPQDVLLESTDLPPVVDIHAAAFARSPRAELISEAVRLIDGARNPVILVGGGARRSGAERELIALAERIQAPVVSTVGGKGVFPWAHELSAQSWVEDRYTTELLENADVLVIVGTSLGEITSNYFTFAPTGRLIQIDAEARVLESNHPALGIHADAALALGALANAVQPAQRPESSRTVRTLLLNIKERLDSQDLGLERGLLADIRSAVPDDADTFWDMTIAGYWAWSAWDPRRGGFHSAQGAGGLGFGFPAALGGAAGTERHTFAVSGDGGAMYSIAELAAARQHNTPVTWLIVDDGGYGILREYMVESFGQATATELARPDFAALAASFGVPAWNATPQTLAADLAAAWATAGPTVVVLSAHLALFAPTHL
ncbi:thiamine pyrophosphate-binding protein [Cryobacterium sp. CG_9.6]|uniref:thiamine pyrophosphate-binding protein n=1 Tax=Cryobacterium sp. CG_9.6 TaxID=2760710 RepID=UPI002473522B|nr:thiamine pyrophosphate-binding protein [Cryobacterium sp. CG_9.6]MDH6236734.1 acetolactate synthase-1/2/3 large subunit [Cryobacterium sp. CG_9.6]